MDFHIVAEIGSNFAKFEDPRMNLSCAYDQIIGAFESGATAVKFQFFTPEDLFGSQLDKDDADALRKFTLTRENIKSLAMFCKDVGIEFMCSAFSPLGFEYINQFVYRHKLASPEFNHPHLRRFLTACGKPVIYSLGCHAGQVPEMDLGPEDIVLECVSKYPASFLDYDLHRMVGLPRWGISDHTLDHDIAVYARSLGAIFFEKHVDFLYGEGQDTPDKCVSIPGDHFAEYVFAIHQIEPIDRDEIKHEAAKKYARQPKEGAWTRPKPKRW